ncbi:MAG: GxxExxY protein [Planctomycetes bacterium]|nr:GxxExxY protein [Planctomycetota bacterium]
MSLIECPEDLIDRVLTAATNVHRELGPGLLESPYESALMIELAMNGIAARSQVEVLVFYKGHELGIGFRADVIVEGKLLLEIKAVKEIDDVHLAQTINYLKLLKLKRGFILNFHIPLLKQGIKRVSI